MSERKAIQTLKELNENYFSEGFDEANEDILLAIKALEEVQKYKTIGTVDECRDAREKQTPKKPNLEGDGYADWHMVYDTWICPSCEKHYEVDYDNYDYCPNCGQHIDRTDWSE